VTTDREDNKFIFELEAFGESLLLPPGFWREFRPLSANSTLAVFASEEYDESDYIRTLDEFYSWKPND
jgi:dTDP-4-dehydrorhamnose 3,5-epimerase-like enzyme